MKQDGVSTRASDESERAVHVFMPAGVALALQEPLLRVSADTTGPAFPPSGSELFKVDSPLPHYRSRRSLLRTSGGTSRVSRVAVLLPGA